MHFIAKLFCLLFLISTSSYSVATEDMGIPDFIAKYTINLAGIEAGELTRSLETQADGYRLFRSETQAKGIFAIFKPELVIETSLWQRVNERIQPSKYSYTKQGGRKDKFMYLDFDWDKHRLHIDDKKRPWSLKLKPKTMDKLVYQIALMTDLAADKKTFSYHIADGGKLKTYNITYLGTETISTPLGEITALKLTRERDRPKDRKTTLWCAPDLNYLPVKLEHIEKDGTVFTASLHELRGIDASSAFTNTHVMAK